MPSIDTPLISVIIPLFNAEKYIVQALESVLKENYGNLEILVINDGSTDNSVFLLNQFSSKIHLLSQENQGPSAARNLGLQHAKGDFIAFLDSDDLWPECHLQNLLGPFLQNEKCEISRGLTCFFSMENNSIQIINEPQMIPMILSAALFKKCVFDRVGHFNPEMRTGEDLDWFNRSRESNINIVSIPELTLLYRRHSTNTTNEAEMIKKGMLDAIRAKLKRDNRKT